MNRSGKERETQKWRRLPLHICVMAVCVLVVALYVKLFSWFNLLVTSGITGFVLHPGQELWMGLGIGFVLGLVILAQTYDWKAWFGRTTRKRPSRPNVVERSAVVCICLTSGLSVLAARKHLAIGPQAVVEQSAFALNPAEYSYADISQVVLELYTIPAHKGTPAHTSWNPAVVIRLTNQEPLILVPEEFEMEEATKVAMEIARRARVAVRHSDEVLPTPYSYYVMDRTLIIILLGTILVTGSWYLFELSVTFILVSRRSRRRRRQT